MKELFLWLLNSSITASWLVLAVLLLRLFLSRTSRKLTCALWVLVAIRLICPISIESAFSVLPTAEPVKQEAFYQVTETVLEGLPNTNEENSKEDLAALQNLQLNPQDDGYSPQEFDLLQVASVIWGIGLLGMAAYAIISSVLMDRRLAVSLCIRSNIYFCDYIDGPFIFGFFRPNIYLPSCLQPDEIPYVLAHEEAHLKRKDYLWKPLGFLLLSVYWFNPVMWVAYKVFCRDIELACDEQVIQNLDTSGKAEYSRTLLRYSGPGALAVGPLAFGEKEVKHRIKNVLRYKKPAVWIIGVGALVIAVAAVCFLTNPVSKAVDNVEDNAATGEITNLLFVGQNTRTSEDYRASDSIVLATINTKNNKLILTAFPGNTYLELGQYRDLNQAVHTVGKSMLRTTYPLGYAWGGDAGALEYLEQCITENYAVSVDGNVEISSDAFIAITDALGGVDVKMDADEMNYMIEQGFFPEGTEAGTIHLDGNHALGYQYMRIPDESERNRVNRQLNIARMILGKCQQLSDEQLDKLFDTVLPVLSSSLNDSQINAYKEALLPIFGSLTIELHQCPEEDAAQVESVDVYGDGYKTAVLIPDLEKCKEMLRTITTG